MNTSDKEQTATNVFTRLSLVMAVLLITPLEAQAGPDLKSAPDTPSSDHLRSAITKGLGFLDKRGPSFQKSKSCVTCHHSPLTVWALREPAKLGFSIDEKALHAFEKEQITQFKNASKSYDQEDGRRQWPHSLASFFILGQPENWNPVDQPKITIALVDAIIRGQRKDGSWKAAVQFTDQRRPEGEAHLLQSMWNLLALSRLTKYDQSLEEHQERALAWIRKTPAPTTVDARALRLLIEQRFGIASQAQHMLKTLLKDQNDDGSWGWVANEQGDAWATGTALYILSFFGEEVPSSQIGAAQAYLTKSQREDGSWLVPPKRKGDDHTPKISSYFGTAWSVMGIARTTPQEHK